jgi:hypothetical protein
MALVKGAATPLALCQHIHSHVDSLKSTLWCQHPRVHPKQMFTAPFVTTAPMPGALALPPTTPNPSEPDAPAENEGDMSTLTAHALQHKPSKTP